MSTRSLFLATLVLSSAVHAAIVDIAVTRGGTADFVTATTGRVREFRAADMGHAPVAFDGVNTYSFTNQFSWVNAHRVAPGGPTAALINFSTTSYDMVFTVQDPLMRGYTLEVDTLLRGYLTGRYDGATSTGARLQISGTAMSGRFDADILDGTDTLENQLNPLTIPGSTLSLNGDTPTGNLLVESSDAFDAGTFIGTRTFGLRFTNSSGNSNVLLQNNEVGEGAVRFGLEGTHSGTPSVTLDATPGADGTPAGDLGHFAAVKVTFVPEPGSATLLLGGLAMLAGCRRRRD